VCITGRISRCSVVTQCISNLPTLKGRVHHSQKFSKYWTWLANEHFDISFYELVIKSGWNSLLFALANSLESPILASAYSDSWAATRKHACVTVVRHLEFFVSETKQSSLSSCLFLASDKLADEGINRCGFIQHALVPIPLIQTHPSVRTPTP